VASIESNISMLRFHSAVQDVTSSLNIEYTFTDLIGAEDYSVYLNRLLVRPSEITSVNNGTGKITFVAAIVATGDEVEVTGWKFT